MCAVARRRAAPPPAPVLQLTYGIRPQGGLDALMGRMEANQAVRKRAEELLEQCRSALAAEAEQDRQARREFGKRWQRPSSDQLAAPMERELQRYDELLSASRAGDEAVGRKVEEHWDAMCKLAMSREELASEIPCADTNAGSVAPEKQRLQFLLEQLDSDVAERTRTQGELERLCEDVRGLMRARDLVSPTPTRLTPSVSLHPPQQSLEVDLMRRGLEVKEVLFDEVQQKHAMLLSQVSESLDAQEQRLREIEVRPHATPLA